MEKSPVNRGRRVVIGLIACGFVITTLLLAAVLIAPKVIDTNLVRGKLRGEIKKISGVEIGFEHLILGIFPHPHIIMDQVTLSLPPGVKGKAASLTVQPRILPLLLGKVKIAGLYLNAAELDYTLPQRPATEKTTQQPFSLDDLGKRIQSVVATLPEFKIPNLDFGVNNSSVNLFVNDRKFLELSSVISHLEGPPAGRKITLNCKSRLWHSISVSGLLNTEKFEVSGQIQLTQFRPQGLVAYLFPDSPIRITDGPANLTIAFRTDEPGQLQAELHGSSPDLKLRYAEEARDLKNLRIRAILQVDKDSIALTLTELALDEPRLSLSANLALTQNTPPLNLQIKGTQIDVASTRQTALAVLGRNEVIKDIFDIVKGGSVPSITVASQGQSLNDLGNRDNIVIRGQMHNGEIAIPHIQFDLKDVSGEVVVSHGILEGQNLQARLGNSSGQNGKLKLGLIEGVAPFYLETDVRADLSELPPILNRLIHDKGIQEELALVKEMEGSANGKLVLGEDAENLKVKVDASDIHLSAHYGRLPHPLRITGGNLTYHENGISVVQLNGSLGKSTFSELSGGLDFGKERNLEITSGSTLIFLADILPWLSSFDGMGELTKYYGGGKGTITLSAIDWKGPLFNPQKWLFNVSGNIEDLVVKNLSQHAIPLTIASATLTATPHQINLRSANVSFSGNRLHAAGNMKRSAQKVLFDMDITADTFDLYPLIQAMKTNSENNGDSPPRKFQSIPVQGNIRFNADRFNFGKFTWNPLHADISLNNDTADVTIKEAVICGISTSGTLKGSRSDVAFDLEAVSKDQDLNPAMTCLVGETFSADGTYHLKARFQGRGKAEDLLKTATGRVEFTAAEGHIYHDIVLMNVLKFLNTLEAIPGKTNFEDMVMKGFGYHRFRVRANLQDGKLRFEEVVLHGRPVIVTAAGEHNLQNGRLDLTLLVAPMVTPDRIFGHIPLIGGILGTLDAIPISAKGTLDSIHLYPLAPSAVGYQLEEMMRKTVERPINIIHGSKAPQQN